jgi:23S rRNA pseudouridine1911/1915/1917 synthase
VTAETEGSRLDQFLARSVPSLSRRTAKLALDIGCVFVNGKRVKAASKTLKVGDRVEAYLAGAFERALTTGATEAEVTPRIVFEDHDLVVVEKPAGVLTAPTPESDRNNLQRALEQRAQRGARVFVVHRLDLQTSGLLVFAKSARANRDLSEIFRVHTLVREYDVFVLGRFEPNELTVRVPVAGRHAISHFVKQQQFAEWTWLRARLETGRTHQIRLHGASLGHPVLQDPEHGRKVPWGPPRMALHARRLAFVHPITKAELNFEAPLPEDMASWLAAQTTSP